MLQDQFNKTIKRQLWEKMGKTNINAVPVIEKVVINCRVPDASTNKDSLETATNEIIDIVGQKPTPTSAKRSEKVIL